MSTCFEQIKPMRYYKAFDVWARQDDRTLVRYRCIEVLPINKFCVQSKDFYYLPFREADALQLDRQFLELLVETTPELRCGMYDTIEEALRAHENDFESEDFDLES